MQSREVTIKVSVYFNYTKDDTALYIAADRGYQPDDKIHLVWEENLDYTFHEDAAYHVFKTLTTFLPDSLPKIMGLRDMMIGDVVYFPEDQTALAKTSTGWQAVELFKVPPPGPGGENKSLSIID